MSRTILTGVARCEMCGHRIGFCENKLQTLSVPRSCPECGSEYMSVGGMLLSNYLKILDEERLTEQTASKS